jgi:hypothetical protein
MSTQHKNSSQSATGADWNKNFVFSVKAAHWEKCGVKSLPREEFHPWREQANFSWKKKN